jgi:hypothetical protein
VTIASVVRAEAAALLAVVALLAAGVGSTPAIIGGVIGAVALATVPVAGRPLTGWASLAVGYAARPRTRVIPVEPPRGHRRRRIRPAAPTDALTALLPGAVLVDAYDRDGRAFAVLAWNDFRTVVVAVDAPEDPLVDLSRPVLVPLQELAAVLDRPELSLHSVQVVSEAWPVRPLSAVRQLTAVARRRTFVAVQARVEGNEGIALRGGAAVGTARLMAAARQAGRIGTGGSRRRVAPADRDGVARRHGVDRRTGSRAARAPRAMDGRGNIVEPESDVRPRGRGRRRECGRHAGRTRRRRHHD